MFSPHLTEDTVLFLHSLFLQLFPDRHLNPKHHVMLPYTGATRRLVPLVHCWSMSFQAKHVFSKGFPTWRATSEMFANTGLEAWNVAVLRSFVGTHIYTSQRYCSCLLYSTGFHWEVWSATDLRILHWLKSTQPPGWSGKGQNMVQEWPSLFLILHMVNFS